ncbi:hypothetical protein AB0O91_38765 [Kitasatospora sp. NPDC089797]|uniref:hypothetical protein n=1 Tax=Kitasatospora sp. NPDC089797 TaxID=3155298 RepID=UPI0034322CCB
MTRSRTDRSPAHRLLAVCALTGAALVTVVTGGQAWADGTPQPAATATAQPTPAAGATVTAHPTPSAGSAVIATAKPTPAAGATGQPTPLGSQPQVREVPKGGAQAGDGSAATDGNGLMLAGGGAVAAVGAGALGFALLRRRSGARG